MIATVILTKNESIHIERAIASASKFSGFILVVDSGSTDNTVELALKLGAKVLQHEWKNYATQFNWALTQLPAEVMWVFRLDADEIITEQLSSQVVERIPLIPESVHGLYVNRRMNFMKGKILFGGVFPVKVVRLFRFGKGHCEDRWMDEHIVVNGGTEALDGELIDDNHNSISWWIEKHNSYASREAVDLLSIKYKLANVESIGELKRTDQDTRKRWIKDKVYARLPSGLRVYLYFTYRYIFRLGFLDCRKGRNFHVLQGFWYRYLVDVKVKEVESYSLEKGCTIQEAIFFVLGITLCPSDHNGPKT